MRILKYCIVLILIIMLHTGMFMGLLDNSTGGYVPPPERKRGDAPPSLVVDNTPSTANTGEMFNFSANFSDDFSVTDVYVNYTYDNNSYYNISMNNVFNETWNATITINQTALTLDYYFIYVDNATNTNSSQLTRITILDTIPPVSEAGPDIEVPQYGALWFDGSGSEDNRGIINYTWFWWCHFCHIFKYAYGEIVNMSWLTDMVDNITMNLTVRDAAGNEDLDSMVILILDRETPIAEIGDDLYIVDQFQLVNFNAYNSWDNVEITNYTWIFDENNTDIYLYGISVNYSFSFHGEYIVALRVTDGEGNSGPGSWDSIRVIVLDISPPIANAGEDVVIDQFMTVVFNGSGSTEMVDYVWNFTHNRVMQYLTGVSPEYHFYSAGVYLVTLNVSDWRDNWCLDTMTVTVLDIEDPVAKAGEDLEILLGEFFVLNASNSWDMVSVVNYSWSFYYNGTDHVLYGEELTFAFELMGVYNITLRVEDERGNYGTDVCTVTTIDRKDPQVNAGSDIVINEGGTAVLDGSGTTDHSPIANYSWSFTYYGNEKKLYGVKVSFGFDIPGVYNVFLLVKDIWGNVGWDNLLIRVMDTTPPTAYAGDNILTTEGKTVILNGSGEDNVGISNYSWRFEYNGELHQLFGKLVPFTFELAGNYTIYLKVRDDDGNVGNDSIWVNVTPLLSDDDPDDDDNDDDSDTGESSSDLDKIKILISVAVIVVFIVVYLIIIISKRRKEQQSSLTLDGIEDESIGETVDEGIEETVGESIEETVDEGIEETVDEGIEETVDESIGAGVKEIG